MSAESNAEQAPGATFSPGQAGTGAAGTGAAGTGPAGTGPAGPGERATPKRGPGPGPAMGGPARFMGGMSTEKALDFKNSSRRLLAMLRPYRPLVVFALVLAVSSVTLAVLGPRLLGEAINVVFDGVRSHHGTDFHHVAQILAVVLALNVGSSV